MHDVYASGNYNFLYATLVASVDPWFHDPPPEAHPRLDVDYNFAGYPSCFFDGGDEVLVGGWSPAEPYQTAISACGARVLGDTLGLLVGTEWIGNDSSIIQVHLAMANGVPVNLQLPDPAVPTGPALVLLDTVEQYSSVTTDPEGDVVYYRWDWGDGTASDWLGPYASGQQCDATHSWDSVGTYDVRVIAKDLWYESFWSAAFQVEAICCLNRGNVDGEFEGELPVTIADLTRLVDFLFGLGAPPPCEEEGNVDGLFDGEDQLPTTITDLTYLVAYLFGDGPEPPPCPSP